MSLRVNVLLIMAGSIVTACGYTPPSAGGGSGGAGSEFCGDGIVGGSEECDDGNASDGDGCTADCKSESTCGNAIIEGVEQCDDGNAADGDGCDSNCTYSRCGNGIVGSDEACDDGNTVNGDNCNATCTLKGESSLFVGMPGQQGDNDGMGTNARINRGQYMVALGDALFLGGYGTVRMVDVPTRQVTTIAGQAGSVGSNDAPNGADARFSWITGIAADETTIWVADHDYHVIRAISTAPPHAVTTIAGFAEYNENPIAVVDGNADAARLGDIRGLAYLNGVVYFMEGSAGVLRGLNLATNQVTTYAGMANMPGDVDGSGPNARFRRPLYVTSDGFLALYISDADGNKIRKYNPVNQGVTTIAGNGDCGYSDGNGMDALLNWPRGLTFDGRSVYFVEGAANTIRQAIPQTAPGTFSVSTLSGTAAACAFNCSCGNLIPGYAEGTPTEARWSFPYDVAYHPGSGSLFVSDANNHVIRRIQ